MKTFKRIGFSISLGLWFSIGFAQTDCKVLVPEIALVYKGECKNGLAHGAGEASGRDRYSGEFRKGLPHGNGTYEWTSGEVYEGNWRNGQRHGQGTYTFLSNGRDSVLTGKWVKDKFIGSGPVSGYVVEYKNNIGRVSFTKLGSALNYVKFRFVRSGGDIGVGIQTMWGSSGVAQIEGDSVMYEMIDFPFKCRLRFSAPGIWYASSMSCELRFTITEPGSWQIIITL